MKVQRPSPIVTPQALAASLDACRRHVLNLLADIEHAAVRKQRDFYWATRRSLHVTLKRLREIVLQAPAYAAAAPNELGCGSIATALTRVILAA